MVTAAPSPEVGCLGHIFFSWMDSMVQLGYKRNKEGDNLQNSDLWELPENLRAAHIVQRYEEFWAEEQAAARKVDRKPKLFKVFWKLTKPWILASACCELLRIAAQYASPLVIKEIIKYIQVLCLVLFDSVSSVLSYILSCFGSSHLITQFMPEGSIPVRTDSEAQWNKTTRRYLRMLVTHSGCVQFAERRSRHQGGDHAHHFVGRREPLRRHGQVACISQGALCWPRLQGSVQ